ncbi:MAG: SPL family radical SAM protein [Thermoplasmatota archaeon]
MVTCHYPLRLDTYSGCSHDCTYCYARNLLSKIGYWKNIRKANVKQIRTYFDRPSNIRDARIRRSIRHKLPVRLGGLTDCFQPLEKRERVTYDVLNILNEKSYPHMIVTKSDLVSNELYADVLDTSFSYIQMTIVSLEKDVFGKIERGAPEPNKRLKALENLSERGFVTTGRISPVIPKVTVDECKLIIDELNERGVNHILIEFFRGNIDMVQELEEKVGVSLRQSMNKRGYYYRYGMKEKIRFYKDMKKYVKNKGMGFSICSDGDPVPPGLNSTKNCCGTDCLPEFQNCVTCVANNIFFESRHGDVSLSYMKKKYWSPDYSKFDNYWKSGEMENMVYGIHKNGSKYSLDGQRKNK